MPDGPVARIRKRIRQLFSSHLRKRRQKPSTTFVLQRSKAHELLEPCCILHWPFPGFFEVCRTLSRQSLHDRPGPVGSKRRWTGCLPIRRDRTKARARTKTARAKAKARKARLRAKTRRARRVERKDPEATLHVFACCMKRMES